MRKILSMLFAAGLLASMASAQKVITPRGCVLENERPDVASDGPWLQTNPSAWWNSAGILSNATLIADGAAVPAVWPQHAYGYNGANTCRVRDTNEDTNSVSGAAVLTFSLGGRVTDISGVVLWNWGEGDTLGDASDRGVQYAGISWSTNGVDFVDTGETLTFAKGPQDDTQVIDADPQSLASTLAIATHLRMAITNFNANAIVGFTEMRIIGERPYAPIFDVDPIVKADGSFGSDYATLSQTLAGSATNSLVETITYEKVNGPGWLVVATNGALSGVVDVTGTNVFTIRANAGPDSTTATLEIFVPLVGDPPVFTTNLIVKANGTFGQDYAFKSQTLADDATDPDPDTLTFSKTAGPTWLNVASNGALSGVCDTAGTNTFTVGVDDGNGNSDTATLQILVEPRPVGTLIAGIDGWTSTTAPAVSYVASNITATASASVVAGGILSVNDGDGRGSSIDGTWGNHEGPPVASTNTTGANVNWAVLNAATDAQITLTIQNDGTENIELGSFHFDALAYRPKAPRTYELRVLAGSGITTGVVYTSSAQAITSIAGNNAILATRDGHDDIDLFLDGLADTTLAPTEVAIFQIAFSGGAGDGSGGHHLFIDNLGVALASDVVVVPDPPVMSIAPSGSDVVVTWFSPAAFKLQTRPSLTSGSWTDVPGATNSPVNVPAINDAEFLRLIQQ